ncbi:MAG: TlpA family protein disulfide reductase [Planctomycetales bacterium]|nr:TlpA family protein disulfide reductase [Planctomycetales bacterium]
MNYSLASRFAVLLLAFTFCSQDVVHGQTLKEEFLSSGITRKIGGYRPIRSQMDQEADIVKVAPDELEAPRYGYFEVGDQKWAYILDEPDEGDATLYVDSNRDGDLTNDPETKWTPTKQGEYTMYSGSGEIDLGGDKVGAINFYRFDPNDKRREALKDSIFYYADFGYEYTFELDGAEFSTFVGGTPNKTTTFPVDRNGDGKLSRRFEVASVGKPFNFTGTTYVFEVTDGALSLEKAAEEIDQMPLPPDLTIGKQALTFTATTMDGDEVNFPSSYAGKIVMLDFWATWCGPCIGEIPHMKEAYANWHENGFDILGISFDRADMEEKILAFLEKNEQSWPQIYEGKMWDTTLGNMHDVSGIPFVLLVDGDSGEILATARQLRGSGLSDFIKGQLEKKFDIKLEDKPKEEPGDDDSKDDKEGDKGSENAEKGSDE